MSLVDASETVQTKQIAHTLAVALDSHGHVLVVLGGDALLLLMLLTTRQAPYQPRQAIAHTAALRGRKHHRDNCIATIGQVQDKDVNSNGLYEELQPPPADSFAWPPRLGHHLVVDAPDGVGDEEDEEPHQEPRYTTEQERRAPTERAAQHAAHHVPCSKPQTTAQTHVCQSP
jgi:hypothetical protein